MNIKLHAKLAAYSKVTNVNQFPEPTESDIGGFVGVGTDGRYTIFKNVTESTIDEMFENTAEIDLDVPNKSLIDSLF